MAYYVKMHESWMHSTVVKAFYSLFYSQRGGKLIRNTEINKSMCLLNDIDDCIQSVILFVMQFRLNAFLSMNSVCIFAYLSRMLVCWNPSLHTALCMEFHLFHIAYVPKSSMQRHCICICIRFRIDLYE